MYGAPGRLERRERDWKLSKCGTTEELWISNGWKELQMKRYLEESKKKEPCGRVWRRKDDGQMMGHTLRHGEHCLGDDILGVEVGKKRGRPRLKYFDQIIGDMGFETFREVKQLAGREPSGDGWLRQTCLRTVYSMMMRSYYNGKSIRLLKEVK